MLIIQSSQWDSSHTSISKYFIERICQLVDYEEVHSNRHRTINGYNAIIEVLEVCKVVTFRSKSISRLKSLLEELSNQKIDSSLKNDLIIQKYFKTIIDYFENLEIKSLSTKDDGVNQNALANLKLNCKQFIKLLNNYYFRYLSNELREIDLKSKHVDTETKKIDRLLNCLIPFLLANEYSISSISEVAKRQIRKRGDLCVYKFLKNFSGHERPFTFIIHLGKTSDTVTEFLKFVSLKRINYKVVGGDEIINYRFNKYTSKIDNHSLYALIEHNCKDPYSFLIRLYDKSLKFIVSSKNREELSFFTDFFNKSYWSFDGKIPKYYSVDIQTDPINVPKRKCTLTSTLARYSINYNYNFIDTDYLPQISSISQSVFYYNLAIGSKSIENSLSLLWTSLESLIPYRLHENDIACVKDFVSNALSIGVVGRKLDSFISRFIQTNALNDNKLNSLNTRSFSESNTQGSYLDWSNWLSQLYSDTNDPYNTIKPISELLTSQFISSNELYSKGTINELGDMIQKSKLMMEYQLDRIYLHRNQIVHSAKFINEYTNLWSHLEWYLGKLLAYCYIYYYTNDCREFEKEEPFIELDGDVKYLNSLISQNQNKPIKDTEEIKELIFKHVWMF